MKIRNISFYLFPAKKSTSFVKVSYEWKINELYTFGRIKSIELSRGVSR